MLQGGRPPKNQRVEIIEKKAIDGVVKRFYLTIDRDGFTLLAMGFEGDKALKFKLDYIAAFNAMEKKLKAMTQSQKLGAVIEPEIVEASEPISEMPTALVVQDEKGQVVTDSLTVAKVFGKRHDNVTRAIEGLLASESVQDEMKKGQLKIELANYKDRQGKPRTKYVMDREGFSLVAFGFTGDKALKFKLDYISAFKAMEEQLSKPAEPLSDLEILQGAVNGLVAQDKRLKELEAKTAQADEKNKAIEEKVTRLDHTLQTNGCEPGWMPLTDAGLTYGGFFFCVCDTWKPTLGRNTQYIHYPQPDPPPPTTHPITHHHNHISKYISLLEPLN